MEFGCWLDLLHLLTVPSCVLSSWDIAGSGRCSGCMWEVGMALPSLRGCSQWSYSLVPLPGR